MFSLGLLARSAIFSSVFICFDFDLAFAAPAPTPAPAPFLGFGQTTSSADPAPVSNATIQDDFLRPALLTSLAYCPAANVTALNCGEVCDQLSGLEILTTGGDNAEIPDFYVAFDPATSAVVVARQGTDPNNFLSDLNDLEFSLVDLNSNNFPNAPGGVQVHDGFQDTFERTTDIVLSTVSSALKSNNANKVTVVGHSLGAAISVMDAIRLRQSLDASVQMTTTVFGLPRGGNQDWANFVDAQLGSTFTHITNKNDPAPRLPPTFIDFQQPSGEVHINTDNSVVSCPGQENEHCSDNNNIEDVSIDDHLGPYFNGIFLSGTACK